MQCLKLVCLLSDSVAVNIFIVLIRTVSELPVTLHHTFDVECQGCCIICLLWHLIYCMSISLAVEYHIVLENNIGGIPFSETL